MKIEIKRLHHIQICIPLGKEEEARAFYCAILGLQEIEKPLALRPNGGFWLLAGDIQLHIGTEPLENKSKRHPAFEIADLELVKSHLSNLGVVIKQAKEIPDWDRYYIYDPFNNRIEFLSLKN